MPVFADMRELLERLVAAGLLSDADVQAWRGRGPGQDDTAGLLEFLHARLPASLQRDLLLAVLGETIGAMEPARVLPDPVRVAASAGRVWWSAALILLLVIGVSWCAHLGLAAARHDREQAGRRVLVEARTRERKGDWSGALASYRVALESAPDLQEAQAGRTRMRETLRFAAALADAQAAWDGGAFGLAADHLERAERAWPGHALVRDLRDRFAGCGRLVIDAPEPTEIRLRLAGGGAVRRAPAAAHHELDLAAGDWEVWACTAGAAGRCAVVRIVPAQEVRVAFERIDVVPDRSGAGLQAALDRARPGACLVLAAGEYREAVRVRVSGLRLEAASGGRVVIRPPAEDASAVTLERVQEIELLGLILSGGTSGLVVVESDRVRIQDCALSGNAVGILLTNAGDVRAENCEIAGQYEVGMFGTARRVEILNCRFSGNAGGDLRIDPADEAVVAGCLFRGAGRVSVELGAGVAVARLWNNVLCRSAAGIRLMAGSARIAHQSFVELRGPALEYGGAGECVIGNSLFVRGVGPALRVNDPASSGALPACDHNAYFGNGALAELRTGNRVDRFDQLEIWQQHSGRDLHSVAIDPMLETGADGVATGRLSPSSVLRGAGTDGEDVGASFDGEHPRAVRVPARVVPE